MLKRYFSSSVAAIKQFKIFTWFLTLSAADMRREDTLKALARQQGKTLKGEIQTKRCSLLWSNPTTAARHFHHRVQSLFTDVILSPASPLGKVNRYFYRIEFQQCGSPHIHAILWVENAAQPNEFSEKISDFVENYIQASISTWKMDLTCQFKNFELNQISDFLSIV